MTHLLPRALLLAAALATVAWLLLSLRAVELEADARALAERSEPPVSTEELSRGQQDLHRAGRFNPDNGPLLVEGQLLLAAQQNDQAAAVARLLIAEEPENYQAWLLAYFAASERARSRQALRRVAELNPWATTGLR